ncbi:hypothetical protein DLAC_02867 [Tieghemostelium lacteum]|uniref:Acyltransferase 3 domain-containing protein n=1 Tax=Tieghemostelium lacteum TaxID=361077 RepID=A0A152A3Z8_TIELA|nr:hypothetical protein DLAC_02867 [Tieghemostelium lacteum]|eukprot:KYR00815.1 hypothetical protein DLAC_02867 [Tieghemostelium lacteum]
MDVNKKEINKELISKTVGTNIKAIAMVAIILGHLIQTRRTIFIYKHEAIATVAVDSFLFLSGYGLTKSYQNSGLDGFFKKRFSTVYIPFVFATYLSGILTSFIPTNPNWFNEVFLTVTFLNANLPMDLSAWFVYYIAMWYFIFFIVHKVNEKLVTKPIVKKWLPLCIFYTISLMIAIFWDRWKIAYLFRVHAISFTNGVLFATIKCPNKMVQRSITLICSIVALVIYLFYFTEKGVLNMLIMNVTLGIAFPLFMVNFDYKLSVLEYCGNLSYEVYLFENHILRRNWSPININNGFIAYFFCYAAAALFKPFHEYMRPIILDKIPTLVKLSFDKISKLIRKKQNKEVSFNETRVELLTIEGDS